MDFREPCEGYVSGKSAYSISMTASFNGNIQCVTGSLWVESSGHRWIPFTKASDAGLWWFLWCAPETKRLNKQGNCMWFETLLYLCQDITRVVIGVSLGVKNQSDQNSIRYIYLKSKYVDCCWTSIFLSIRISLLCVQLWAWIWPSLFLILRGIDQLCITQ